MKLKKWIFAAFFSLTLSAGISAVAVSAAGYDRREMVAEEEIAENEEELVMARAKVSPKAWKKINGVCYNGSGVEIPGAITRGIDVSEWQGTIDWTMVKNSGVDFAFVRVAYGKSYIDKKYAYNMEQAAAAGVPVGTYIYSLATTPTEALREAALVIKQMKGYKVSYPVVFDLEYAKMGERTKKQIGVIAKTFCDEIKKAGYYPMVYCNTNWYKEKVDWSQLSGMDVWIAQYGDKIQAPSSSSYKYTIWQATDGSGGGTLNPTKGLISGIPSSNNVDVNFGYVDYTKKIAPRWQPVSGYKLPTFTTPTPTPTPAVIKKGWVTEGGKTYYYVNNKKTAGWKKISGKYYYFNRKDGSLYKSTLLRFSTGNYCYVNKNGARVSKKWITWKKNRYYINSKGYAVKGWKKIGGKYYCFDSKTAYMYRNKKLISKAGNVYYVGSNGVRYSGGFHTITENGKKYRYYFAKNGRAYKGWHTIKGRKCYFCGGRSQRAGRMVRNTTLTSKKGVVYVFNKAGVCIKKYKKN